MPPVQSVISDPDAIVWQEDGGMWLGHLQRYPDYWTQGEDLEDLREHLRDLHAEITSGGVPGLAVRDDG